MGVPVAGVISDGQHSNCKAVATVRLEVPHQLCRFYFLREAALPIFEADQHAKKKLKKAVRGVRPIERAVGGCRDAVADLVRGAITDDGRAPHDASGLRLKERWERVAGSLERVRSKGGPRGRSRGSRS